MPSFSSVNINFCIIHQLQTLAERRTELCKSFFDKSVLAVSIIYFHHLELFTTTDYGIRLSSSLQKPELHGLIKALLSTRWIITRIVSDYIFLYFNSAVYCTVFYIHIYFTVSVQIVICMFSFRAASFNKFELRYFYLLSQAGLYDVTHSP